MTWSSQNHLELQQPWVAAAKHIPMWTNIATSVSPIADRFSTSQHLVLTSILARFQFESIGILLLVTCDKADEVPQALACACPSAGATHDLEGSWQTLE
jgi:hypothetical protein